MSERALSSTSADPVVQLLGRFNASPGFLVSTATLGKRLPATIGNDEVAIVLPEWQDIQDRPARWYLSAPEVMREVARPDTPAEEDGRWGELLAEYQAAGQNGSGGDTPVSTGLHL